MTSALSLTLNDARTGAFGGSLASAPPSKSITKPRLPSRWRIRLACMISPALRSVCLTQARFLSTIARSSMVQCMV
ncbi:hypothetical protein D3C85_1650360 [compost metagenome]